MKRAQIEIVGLLIIVLIVSFVLLFVFSQVLTSEPEDRERDFHEDLVEGWVFSMLDTDTNCLEARQRSMQDLITDCAMSEADASTPTLDCHDGIDPEDSCDYIEENIGEFIDSTIKEWGDNPYVFRITRPGQTDSFFVEQKADDDLFDARGTDCTPFVQPLPVGMGVPDIQIVIALGGGCRDYDILS